MVNKMDEYTEGEEVIVLELMEYSIFNKGGEWENLSIEVPFIGTFVNYYRDAYMVEIKHGIVPARKIIRKNDINDLYYFEDGKYLWAIELVDWENENDNN